MRIAIALALVVAACGHRDAPSPTTVDPGSAAAAVSTLLADAAIAAKPRLAGSMTIQVADLGKEPKQLLRYHLPVGPAAKLVFTIGADFMGQRVPTLTLTTSTQVTSVDPDGTMHLRITIDGITARDEHDPAAATMLTSRLAQTIGATLTATLDTTGAVNDLHLALAAGKTADETDVSMLSQSFSYLAVRVPSDPVGVGARWTHSVSFHGGGLNSIATTTMTVTALAGDTVTLALSTDIGGPKQTVADDAGTIDVQGIAGTGSGTVTVTLGTLATHAQMSSQLRAAFAAAGSQDQTDATMTLGIDTEP
jgi:hypothetical protein